MKINYVLDIPDGYAIDASKEQEFVNKKDKIFMAVYLYKQIVKDFDWYVSQYESVLPMSGLNSDIYQKYATSFINKDYESLPFEINMGLLKYICDDSNVDVLDFVKWLTKDKPNPNQDYIKIVDLCPLEFLNTIK
jgi:hypothetical protein